MPFQINVEKEIFKNNWFSLLVGIRQCLNGSLRKKRQSMHGAGGRVDGDYVNIALYQSIQGVKLFRFPT